MTAADRSADLQVFIEALYEIQVSAAMLVEQLARDRAPAWSDKTMMDIIYLHRLLQHHHPSLERH